MVLFCPFCSEEITPRTTECPSCDHTYNANTLSFLALSRKAHDTYRNENRKQVRFPIKLSVIASTPEAVLQHHTSNLSLGGLFIETSTILSPGTKLELKLFLFDAAGPMQVPCEVIWSQREERLGPMGKLRQGMGVRFLNLSEKNIEGLIDISNRILS